MMTKSKAKPKAKGTSAKQATQVGQQVEVPAEGTREGQVRCA